MRTGEPRRTGWRRRGRPRHAGALTPRQQDVFELMATGLTNEEIAQQLGITPYGVKYHVAEILQRLGAENRYEAASLHLRAEGNGQFGAWAPVMFLRKLPFAWLPKAAAGAVLTTAAVGVALLAWGVMSTSTVAVTTTSCTSVEQRADRAPPCAPGAISAGASNTCALKDGGVWCWGDNQYGQLGNHSTTGSSAPVAVSGLASGVSAISVGTDHTCALKGGGVWCWGLDQGGGPPDVTVCVYEVKGPPCMSTAPVAVPGLASGVTAISGPSLLRCAVKDGGVWCRGNNEDDSPDAPPGLTSGVSAISVGESLRCALRDGGAWCWGSNWGGQLGNDSTTDSLVPVAVSGLGSGVSAISAGMDHVCALKGGGVWCWGWNGEGQLGDNSKAQSHVPVPVSGLTSGVSAISAADAHTCALKDGGVWCWGLNSNGELGNNRRTGSPVPVAVSGLTSGVSSISAGGRDSCAVKDDGFWCWGRNGAGQLGNNSTTDSLVPVMVQFTPPSAGDIAAGPDGEPLPSQTSADSADHRMAYTLAGAGAAALAIVAAGMWAVGRRRQSRTGVDDLDVWRRPGT